MSQSIVVYNKSRSLVYQCLSFEPSLALIRAVVVSSKAPTLLYINLGEA